jgi:maleylacetoacetate isomerase/maleylpyruvate isomerase
LAIIEYLDETRPQPALLPGDAAGRARVRAVALAIACEIHPLNNLRVLGYLSKTLGVSDEQRNDWYRHWVETGLETVEAMLVADSRTGSCCHGDMPTLADICLVPQIFNAQRFKARLDHVPTVMRIHEHCLTLPAFAQSVPVLQPDAE